LDENAHRQKPTARHPWADRNGERSSDPNDAKAITMASTPGSWRNQAGYLWADADLRVVLDLVNSARTQTAGPRRAAGREVNPATPNRAA
jgi:hypothetical protein